MTQNTQLTVAQQLDVQFVERKQEFIKALPNNITYDKFERVAKTAIIRNTDLLMADRPSLMLSCLMSAQDGLLPDGKEAALVIYNTKVNNNWIKKVQYMPMVNGILKKIRNSGELLSISAYVVHDEDEFEFSLGDDEHIIHKPNLDADITRIKCVYAIAKTKDGGIYREIMTKNQVNAIRNKSKAYFADKSCIWNDHWEEMAKKTVIRRLSKRLPMNTDLVELISRDDNLHTIDATPSKQRSVFDDFKDTAINVESTELINDDPELADEIAQAEQLQLLKEATNGTNS